MIRSMPSSRARSRGGAAADAAVDRDDDARAGGVQAIDVGRLQAVAVAQALRQEVRDVAAEQLERAAQDHRRRDAVDVVVAVDRDPLLARDRGQQALDRRRRGRSAGTDRGDDRATARGSGAAASGVVDAALAQQAGDDRRHVERRGQRRDVRVAIARVGLPARLADRPRRPAPSVASDATRSAPSGSAPAAGAAVSMMASPSAPMPPEACRSASAAASSVSSAATSASAARDRLIDGGAPRRRDPGGRRRAARARCRRRCRARCRSGAVIFSASAASTLRLASRHRIAAQPSGGMTL